MCVTLMIRFAGVIWTNFYKQISFIDFILRLPFYVFITFYHACMIKMSRFY